MVKGNGFGVKFKFLLEFMSRLFSFCFCDFQNESRSLSRAGIITG